MLAYSVTVTLFSNSYAQCGNAYNGNNADSFSVDDFLLGTYCSPQSSPPYIGLENHYSLVNGATDTTALQVTGNTTEQELETLGTTIQTGIIQNVAVNMFSVASTSGCSAETLLYTSPDTLYNGASTPISSGALLYNAQLTNYFNEYSTVYTTDPETGAPWTWAEINNLQIGAQATILPSGDTIQFSQFNLEVNFTDATQVSITITSNPAGSGFVSVDGTPVITPATFNWDSGDTHTITANSQVTVVAEQSQCVFNQWVSTSIGAQSTSNYTYTVPSGTETVTANYLHQYFFQVTSPYGNPAGQGWYNAGTPISSTVTTPSNGYTTTGWTGSGSLASTGGTFDSNATGTFTINQYTSCTWNWETSPLNHFSISVPASATAGSSFSSVVVTAYDAYNNVLTTYTGPVYFTSSDSQAIMPYMSSSEYVFTSANAGTCTFSGFTLETAGYQTITVTAGNISQQSANITVNDGPISSITISPSNASIAAGSTQPFTATAYDACGNSWSISPSWSISNGAGGTWNSNAYTSANAGTWTVTATDSSATGTTMLTVTLTATPTPLTSSGNGSNSETTPVPTETPYIMTPTESPTATPSSNNTGRRSWLADNALLTLAAAAALTFVVLAIAAVVSKVPKQRPLITRHFPNYDSTAFFLRFFGQSDALKWKT